MKKQSFALLLILVLHSLTTFSQENSDTKRILESIWNKQYEVNIIPDDALSGNYDILVYPYILRENEQNGIIYALEISWESGAIDGRYIMEITPMQILLYSQHDNRNSNYLYWITNLNDGDYDSIKTHLKNLASNEDDVITDTYSGKLCFTYNWLFADPALLSSEKNKRISEHTIYEKMYDQITKEHLYINVYVLIKEINECLKDRYISFPEKNEFFKTKIIRLVNDNNELIEETSETKQP